MGTLTHSVSLAQLFVDLPTRVFSPIPDISIRGICSDSRQVKPGDMFVALVGGSSDGHQFIPNAIELGAAVVVGTKDLPDLTVPYIRVEESRQALPFLAAAFYGYPARKMTVIGITGTDGKTTTASLIYSILKEAGVKVGMISTVSASIGEQNLDTGFHVTTPDPVDVQYFLAQMVEAGLSHVILEATSHGLAQYRVDACEFDIAIITNITHEHLDYHGTYESYRAAKARLFTQLTETRSKSFSTPKIGVLNRDDNSYDFLSQLLRSHQVSYGFSPEADLRAEEAVHSKNGLHFIACSQELRIAISSPMLGFYNVSNCLAAIATTFLAIRLPPEAIQDGIANFKGVPGRMERIEMDQDFTCLVDFAHTPNALQNVLETCRQLTSGRIVAIFGSAGLRDREKRRIMAEISAQLADFTILTAEDPRTESVEMILDEMVVGATSKGGVEGKTFWRISDRGNAIRYAMKLARKGDIVIACGKGHEQSMCFGTIEFPWDDRTAMRAALAEYLHIPGPQMPHLPTLDDKMDVI